MRGSFQKFLYILISVCLYSLVASAQTVYPPDTIYNGLTPASPLPRPGYLQSAIEPTYGAKITRISDDSMNLGNSQYMLHNYSKDQPWNSDMTMIKLSGAVAILDAKTYKVIRKSSYRSEAKWSTVDPNIIFYISGSQFRKWNVKTGEDILLRSFSGSIYMGPWEGNLSVGDRYVALVSSGTFIVYDIVNNAIVSTKGVFDLGGFNEADWISMSPSGKYVVVCWRQSSSATGAAIAYDRYFNKVAVLSSLCEHADLGYDVAGNEVYVQVCPLIMSRLSDGIQTRLLGSSYYLCGHLSMRNYKRPGFALYSNTRSEVFAIKLDTSNIVERFAHAYGSSSTSYDAQAKGVISPDGSKVMWNSDWGGGTVYAYVAEMPNNNPYSTTSTTSTVSIDTQAPSVPSGLSALSVSTSQINITFNSSTDNVGVAGYMIYRNGSLLTKITATGYSDINLMSGTSYSYNVAAYDSAGNVSGLSSLVMATTQLSTTTREPASTTTTGIVLDMAKAVSDGGFAVLISVASGVKADNSSFPNQSTLRLFENEKEIGPAHTRHADIRNLGLGRFSHWASTDGSGEALRFSASDNSNPRTNGRVYSYLVTSSTKTTSTSTTSTASNESVGPKAVVVTDLSRGKYFAHPNGSGFTCSQSLPCALQTAIDMTKPGEVTFLRGGVYNITQSIYFRGAGTSTSPITIESYPGELAILDGSKLAAGQSINIRVTGSRNILRRFEIRNMPREGLWIGGTYNIVDGLYVHHSKLSGVAIFSPYEAYPYGKYGSYNVIKNCVLTDNSDAGLSGNGFADGGNSDGIAISSGDGNRVINNLVSRNSDDGIDSWRSTNTFIGYNIISYSGIASGNGNGVKAGGQYPSSGTIVEHNISYKNRAAGVDVNSGVDVKLNKNTTWSNAGFGFYTYASTTVDKNISSADGRGPFGGSGKATSNSWQRSGTVQFISTFSTSSSFLVPTVGGGFEDIGAFAP